VLSKVIILLLIVLSSYLFIYVFPSSGETSKIILQGNHFYVDNQIFKPRGIFYYQPNAYRQHLWDDLNISMLDEDFRKIKNEGFNTIHVEVTWGSFMPTIDLYGGTYTRNLDNEQKLATLVDKAKEYGLYVIPWIHNSKAPQGVDAKYHKSYKDACGVQKSEFYGYLVRCLQANSTANDNVWKLFLEFHRNIANLVKDKDNIIWDPLDWQHLYLNEWTYGDPCNLNAWIKYLKGINPDINYWNNRWNETNSNWESVLFPIDAEWKKNLCPNATHCAPFLMMYVNVPVIPWVSPNQNKWDDFRKYQNQILINNIKDITATIKSVDTDALIGQRVDLWRYGGWRSYAGYRNETWGVPYVDFIFAGEYPYNDTQSVFQGNTINYIKSNVSLPIYVWETGAFSEYQRQKEFLTSMVNFVDSNNLLGFGIWSWRDSCWNASKEVDSAGLLYMNNTAKQALPALVKLFNPPGACSDGTAHEHCSLNKPKYCNNGNLIDKCQQCGCSSDKICRIDGSCSITATSLREGLVGEWKLDEGSGSTASDSSGYGNNGVLGNASDWSLPTWTGGEYGNVLNFNGSQFVNVSYSSSLRIPGAWTIQTRIKPNTLQTGWHVILRRPWNAGSNYAIYTFGAKARLYVDGLTQKYIESTANLAIGNWYDIVGVWRPDESKLYMYVNCDLDLGNVTTMTGTPAQQLGNLMFGLDVWNQNFNGAIDEVRIWNRSLSVDEVEKLCESVTPTTTTTSQTTTTSTSLITTTTISLTTTSSTITTSLPQNTPLSLPNIDLGIVLISVIVILVPIIIFYLVKK